MQGLNCNYLNNTQNNYKNIQIPKINQNCPTFKGHAGQEIIWNSFKKVTQLKQETAFFRQLSGLNFVKEYATKMFQGKDTIRILDGACSTGEESWTLAMLFHDFPRKVKITGFDLGKKAIEQAKIGVYPISKMEINNPYLANLYDAYKDSYVAFQPNAELSEQQAECQRLFNGFFERISSPKEKISLGQRLKRFLYGKYMPKVETKYYRLKPEKTGLCDFVQGDITKLDNIAQDGEVDVLLFRNALYHLITKDVIQGMRLPKPREESQPILEKVFEEIRRKLSGNGILVLGNDETMQTLDGGLTQEVLFKKGFRPIFKDSEEFSCVWQKI